MNTNSTAWLQIVIPMVTAVVSSVGTYFVTSSNNKKDLTVSDRQLLSEDEKIFRKELKDTINMNRDEINSLKKETKSYKDEISSLRDEVRLLREVNLHLEVENQKLVIKVENLSQQIIRLEKMNEKDMNENADGEETTNIDTSIEEDGLSR